MADDLKNKDSNAYKDKLALAMKAFEEGCFIFSCDSKKLYTPREFMECPERVTSTMYGLQEIHNMNLLYVDHLVKSKLEDLRKAQDDYDAFMKKVMNSFKLSPREPMKKRK